MSIEIKKRILYPYWTGVACICGAFVWHGDPAAGLAVCGLALLIKACVVAV